MNLWQRPGTGRRRKATSRRARVRRLPTGRTEVSPSRPATAMASARTLKEAKDLVAFHHESPYDGDITATQRKAAADRDLAAYTLAEAARYLRLPLATLRSWVLGRQYPTAEGSGQFPPLMRPASRRPPLLSFSNLIEA